MLGYAPFGELPFSTLRPEDLHDETVVTWYHASRGYTSAAADSPASTHFEGRLSSPLSYHRSMLGGGRVGGLVDSGGDIIYENGDGELDTLLSGFSVDGRDVTVRMGRAAWALSDFGVIFRGLGDGWIVDETAMRLRLRDGLFQLEQPIQTTYYAGSGGNEGGDDLKGKPKPLLFGKCRNIPAVPVDTTNLVYQVHDGAVNDITAAYDRGVALTLVGGSPSSGQFSIDTTNGRFTLGGAPDGLVTADAEGHADPTYVSDTSGIVKRIVEAYAGFDDTDLDNPSFASLATDAPATVGLWIGAETVSMLAVVLELLTGVSGFVGFNRLNLMQVGVFKAPSGTAAAEFDERDIISIEREPLPGDLARTTWRQRVGYARNFAVQTDIAGSVSASHRAFIAEQYRIAAAADASVQARHPLATDPIFVPGLYANESDAETEATRLLALYSVDRALYRVQVKRNFWSLDLNDVVHLTYPRWGLAAGAFGRIVELREDAGDNVSELTVFV